MKMAVVGAGAMGSIFAARFVEGGHETVLVDVAAPLVDRINSEGVTIVQGDKEVVTRIPATTDPSTVGRVEVAVFCVKCYQTEAAAELARPLVGPETVAASLQNGWGNGDVLARTIPADQIVVGVTYNSGTVLGPARVDHSGAGATTVGSFTEKHTEGAERLAAALRHGGLDATVAVPIRPEIWKKLILNAASLPTAALTGMSSGALVEHECMRELVSQVTRESVAVARALGYEVDEEERLHHILELARGSQRKASMLQDFEAGRRTEIDVITGAVVRAATETRVPVPANRALMALVQGWEIQRGLR